tara:strand:- start:2569 stop:3444 length:876 start_codon:yes stop_codon:yes gene_type:complete
MASNDEEIQNGDEYSSSENEQEEEEQQPPPAPKKKKVKKVIQAEPVHYPTVKKKAKKKIIEPEPEPEPEPMDDDDDDDDEEEEEEVPSVPQKKKRKKPDTVLVPTSNPNIVVEMKRRKPGPRTQNVVIYEEDLPQPKIKLSYRSHKKGRPKTKQEVVYEKDEGVDIQEDKVVIDRPGDHKKPPNARQIKRMELDQKFVEMEAIAGRKLRQTKSGKIDKRSIKERSPAQIAAARRLAEYNKELRKQKAAEKNKQSVKEVITELAVVKEMRDKDKKKQQEKKQEPQPFSLFVD